MSVSSPVQQDPPEQPKDETQAETKSSDDAPPPSAAAAEPSLEGRTVQIEDVQIASSSADAAEPGPSPATLAALPVANPSHTSISLETSNTAPTFASTGPAPAAASSSSGSSKEKRAGYAAAFTMPVRKRRRDEKSASDGAHTASSTTERAASPREKRAKRTRRPFIVRLFRRCIPCLPLLRDRDAGDAADEVSYSKEKGVSAEVKPSRESSESSSAARFTYPQTEDTEVVVPPKQLLPESETDGVTSGAVQPPGSTGHDVAFERPVTKDNNDEDSLMADDEAFRQLIDVEELDDEEDRLIRSGGCGIPIGPDGKPRPLLPPVSPQHLGRKCLVLDLDETLVHSSLRAVPSPDYVVPVEIESFWHNFYVLKRPGVDGFLQKMGEIYEVVVFTASLSKYADPVLDRLDPHNAVAHRLFRESCYNHRGNYVKDLSQLGRPVGDTIILDNSPASYIFHPHNAVPVSSWFNDPHDTELADLCPFLADLGALQGDVRGVLDQTHP